MKIVYISLLFLILLGYKRQVHTIPKTIKLDFNNRITNAENPIWESEEDGYEVEFKISGVEGSVNYDLKGNWTETEYTIDILKLPQSIGNAIAQKYEGFDITGAESIVTPTMDGYEIEISNKDVTLELVYNSNAKFIMQKSDDTNEEN